MRQGVGGEPVGPDQVRSALDKVFADPSFNTEPSLLEEFFEWLRNLFDFGPIDSGSLLAFWNATRVGTVVVAVCVVLMLVYYLRKAWGPRQTATGPVQDRARLLQSRVAELRAAARAAELDGDHLLALRLFFFALVVGLGERGELAYNDAWTNRELLERGKPTSEVAETLRPLVGELDSMSFGMRSVESVDVKRFEVLCDRWLGQVGA